MLVLCMIAFVTVIGIIGAVVSTLSGDGFGGQTERSVGLPPRSVRRKRMSRRSQQLRTIEAALVPSESEPPPRCSVPHAHERSRRR